MRVYLAGDVYLREILASKTDKELSDLYFLRTFARKEPWFMPYYGKCKDIILDSGAFTFMAGKDASNVDWNDYIERYAGFINATGVEHFIELDIDVIVGYKKVKELRNKLIGLTGKQLAELLALHLSIQEMVGTKFTLESGARMVYDKVAEAYKDAEWISVTASCGMNRHMPAEITIDTGSVNE